MGGTRECICTHSLQRISHDGFSSQKQRYHASTSMHCIFLFVLWEDTQGSTLNALDLALDFSCQKDVFAFLFAQFLKSLEEVW
jgi:hypothetical protein